MSKLGSLALMLVVLLQSNLYAEDYVVQKLDYEACRVLVQKGEILSMAELMEVAKSMADGHIIDTTLLKKGPDYIYEMEIAGSDGMVKMFYVDARNGTVSHLLDDAGDESQLKES